MGDWVDKMELQVLSSYPASSNYIQVDDFEALETIEEKMADIICNSKFWQNIKNNSDYPWAVCTVTVY